MSVQLRQSDARDSWRESLQIQSRRSRRWRRRGNIMLAVGVVVIILAAVLFVGIAIGRSGL